MSFLDRLKSLFSATGQDAGNSGSPMITCEEALGVVHDFLDGELDGVSEEQRSGRRSVTRPQKSGPRPRSRPG